MGYQEQIFEQAATLGGEVAAALQPARDYLSRADALNKQLEAARKAEEAEYAKLVESAASTGKLPTLNGWGRWVFDSPSSKLVVASVALCHQKASAAAREAGPAILAALQARTAAIVDESVELAKSLPDFVNDERSAMRAGDDGKHFATWVRLGELLTGWDRCHELSRLLQRAGTIDGPGHPKDRPGAWTFQAYKVPHRLATIRGPVARERHLAAAVAVGAEPGLYPWDDAVARFVRLDRRQRDYRPMQILQTHDGLGNVIAEERGPDVASEFVSAPSRR